MSPLSPGGASLTLRSILIGTVTRQELPTQEHCAHGCVRLKPLRHVAERARGHREPLTWFGLHCEYKLTAVRVEEHELALLNVSFFKGIRGLEVPCEHLASSEVPEARLHGGATASHVEVLHLEDLVGRPVNHNDHLVFEVVDGKHSSGVNTKGDANPRAILRHFEGFLNTCYLGEKEKRVHVLEDPPRRHCNSVR